MSERHIPVLLDEVIAALAPQAGERMIDGTFGAGGYSRAILATAGVHVLGIDRDPSAIAAGEALGLAHLTIRSGVYSDMEALADAAGFAPANGIVLDIGVSSMQIDDAARGFSFQKDGPLDMRMSSDGPSAADVVNRGSEGLIADILFHYGEERRARAIAKAIVAQRKDKKFEQTSDLVAAVVSVLGRGRPDQIHPATRTFQALRIFVNDELGELARGLAAAERLLAPEGRLAVVTFHSLEDRIVKRFLAARCGRQAGPSRHMPQLPSATPSFSQLEKGVVSASDEELARNPRARSAKLRAARRTHAPAHKADALDFNVPAVSSEEWSR
ncbi:Ribosomal RNA small subunit methyltransferase H [Alphaproteobacteria bacterium SO-S41]|nr:Ribosomal RNA small subunit methyltransferase H [Alphaproteobacteria bacterium SO-S41]